MAEENPQVPEEGGRQEQGPRKRKRRGGEGEGKPTPRERMEQGYAKAEVRNREAREALQPLAEGERPAAVTIGAAIAALIAISIVTGYLSGAKVNGAKPHFAQVLAPALLMGIMAWGMWRARYWAVLGFQLILVFLIFASVSGIAIDASSVGEFAYFTALLVLSGTLFFFMVKAMARIQMPTREPRE